MFFSLTLVIARLIVTAPFTVKATNAGGGAGFAITTVVVPLNRSPRAERLVESLAAAAKAFADANNGAPPARYFTIGLGPVIGPKQ